MLNDNFRRVLYTGQHTQLYSPLEHPDGTTQKTKQEAPGALHQTEK